MNEFDDITFLSADELICYLGLGMLAAGMVAGLLFAMVPLARYVIENVYDKWMSQKQTETSTKVSPSLLPLAFAQPESA